MFLRDQFLPLLNAKLFLHDLRNFSLSGKMHQNWLEKPSVEQNNHYFLNWFGRGIGS